MATKHVRLKTLTESRATIELSISETSIHQSGKHAADPTHEGRQNESEANANRKQPPPDLVAETHNETQRNQTNPNPIKTKTQRQTTDRKPPAAPNLVAKTRKEL